MQTVHVTRDFSAPVDRVYAHLAEHENLSALFGLTEAQGGTFVDGEMGMDPADFGYRVFDLVAGRRYFSSWMAQTLVALDEAARSAAAEGAAR